jgi:hypothetical protein
MRPASYCALAAARWRRERLLAQITQSVVTATDQSAVGAKLGLRIQLSAASARATPPATQLVLQLCRGAGVVPLVATPAQATRSQRVLVGGTNLRAIHRPARQRGFLVRIHALGAAASIAPPQASPDPVTKALPSSESWAVANYRAVSGGRSGATCGTSAVRDVVVAALSRVPIGTGPIAPREGVRTGVDLAPLNRPKNPGGGASWPKLGDEFQRRVGLVVHARRSGQAAVETVLPVQLLGCGDHGARRDRPVHRPLGEGASADVGNGGEGLRGPWETSAVCLRFICA